MPANWQSCHKLFLLLLFFILLMIPAALAQAAEELGDEAFEPRSAWDVLVRHNPRAAGELRLSERQILEQLTPEQGEAFAAGDDPAGIVLDDGTLLADLIAVTGSFTIPSWSVDAGGGVATGGAFSLTATIGQPDAGRLAGGGCTTLDGGFLHASSSSTAVFVDGFESGDDSCWSSSVGALSASFF